MWLGYRPDRAAVNEGDEYGVTPTTWDMRVLVAPASAPDTTSEVVHFTTDQQPLAIAYYGGALFLAIGYGEVQRATAL